jgi:hypothetical protein
MNLTKLKINYLFLQFVLLNLLFIFLNIIYHHLVLNFYFKYIDYLIFVFIFLLYIIKFVFKNFIPEYFYNFHNFKFFNQDFTYLNSFYLLLILI